jgi:hypothetical protein
MNQRLITPPWSSPQDLQNRPVDRPLRGTSQSGGYGANALIIRDPHHYANLIDQSVILPQNLSQLVLPVSPAPRNMLLLRNFSTSETIFIGWGRDASNVSTLALASGTPWGTEVLFDVVVPQDDMYAFTTGSAVTLCFAYSTIGN